MYKERIHDARLIIPILNGLTQKELIEELPNLIQLPNTLVKVVIFKLLQCKPSPISPTDLLISLHLIDFSLFKSTIEGIFFSYIQLRN